MDRRLTIIILAVIALGAGIWAYFGSASPREDALAPAWQLTPTNRYYGKYVTDPFVSWSPDSRSLLFGYFNNITFEDRVLKWNVGEKSLRFITMGASPNYVTNDEFLYMIKKPATLYRRSLSTGRRSEILPNIKSNPFRKNIKGFTYDPINKTIALRMVDFTCSYLAGTERYNMAGKRLPDVNSYMGDNILDRSDDPRGNKCAVIVGTQQGEPASLQIAKKGKDRGREVATGILTAAAWRPTSDAVAYGEDTSVFLLRPSDGKTAVVARFSPPSNKEEERFVARLSWSPNGDYLAVFVYVSGLKGDYPLIYVLDLSKFRWM